MPVFGQIETADVQPGLGNYIAVSKALPEIEGANQNLADRATLRSLASDFGSSDPEAQRRATGTALTLPAIGPPAAKGIADMNADQRAALDHTLGVTGGLAGAILNSPAASRAQLYKDLLPIAQRAGARNLPPEYPGDDTLNAHRLAATKVQEQLAIQANAPRRNILDTPLQAPDDRVGPGGVLLGRVPVPGEVPAAGVPAGGAAPAGGGGPGPIITGGDATQPRGMRNNNPLNLEHRPDQGALGSDGRFGVYATMQDGINAASRQLLIYQETHGLKTVNAIINRWAPPGENNSSAYAATVARALGVDPNTPINLRDPDTMRRMITAMSTVENGPRAPSPYAVSGQVSGGPRRTAAVAAAGEAAPSPGIAGGVQIPPPDQAVPASAQFAGPGAPVAATVTQPVAPGGASPYAVPAGASPAPVLAGSVAPAPVDRARGGVRPAVAPTYMPPDAQPVYEGPPAPVASPSVGGAAPVRPAVQARPPSSPGAPLADLAGPPSTAAPAPALADLRQPASPPAAAPGPGAAPPAPVPGSTFYFIGNKPVPSNIPGYYQTIGPRGEIGAARLPGLPPNVENVVVPGHVLPLDKDRPGQLAAPPITVPDTRAVELQHNDWVNTEPRTSEKYAQGYAGILQRGTKISPENQIILPDMSAYPPPLVSEGGKLVPKPMLGLSTIMNTGNLPIEIVKLIDTDLTSLQVGGGLKADTARYQAMIDQGKIPLGPGLNTLSEVQNRIGWSTEQTANYNSFIRGLQGMRDQHLKLATGVQTDQDAQRAWQAFQTSLHDPRLASQMLAEIQGKITRDQTLYAKKINDRLGMYQKPQMDVSAYTNQPAAVGPRANAAPAANGGAGAEPSPRAVQHLLQNPGLAAEFDQKFGAGASRRVLGQ